MTDDIVKRLRHTAECIRDKYGDDTPAIEADAADEIDRLRAEVERLTRERDAAFTDRDAEERERIYLEAEMGKRQPYDAATPFYPENVTENGILERLRGLGFGSMEREVASLIARAEIAERRVEKLREVLFGLNASLDVFWNDPQRPSLHAMKSNSVAVVSTWQAKSRAALAEMEK